MHCQQFIHPALVIARVVHLCEDAYPALLLLLMLVLLMQLLLLLLLLLLSSVMSVLLCQSPRALSFKSSKHAFSVTLCVHSMVCCCF